MSRELNAKLAAIKITEALGLQVTTDLLHRHGVQRVADIKADSMSSFLSDTVRVLNGEWNPAHPDPQLDEKKESAS